jgi:hypothetical protein
MEHIGGNHLCVRTNMLEKNKTHRHIEHIE